MLAWPHRSVISRPASKPSSRASAGSTRQPDSRSASATTSSAASRSPGPSWPGPFVGEDEGMAADHDRALTAVRLSARRMLRTQRLVYGGGLLVGGVIYGLLIGTTADQSLVTTLWRTAMWVVVMAAFGWLFVRGADQRMRAYQRVEALTAVRVVGVSNRLVTVSATDAPDRPWPFGRGAEELTPGDDVWLAEVTGAPVAVAHGSSSTGEISVVWSVHRAASGPR